MIKAIIYKPAKTSMQSGLGKTKKWILKYNNERNGINPLMDGKVQLMLTELKLEFSSKEEAIKFAKKII